jgi:hypothetical protein
MKINIENKESQQFLKLDSKALKDEFINNILKHKIEGNYYDSDFPLEEELEKKIFAENSFLQSVLQVVLKAKKDNPNSDIITLFDIDETIAYNDYIDNTNRKTFVRPSVLTLLPFLKEQKIQIGLLSNRTEIESQLNDNENLGLIKKYISPELILSTRGTLYFNDEERLDGKYKKERFVTGDFEKINFLEKFVVNYPNAIIIPIDDLSYPIVFEYGVALTDQEKFFI